MNSKFTKKYRNKTYAKSTYSARPYIIRLRSYISTESPYMEMFGCVLC